MKAPGWGPALVARDAAAVIPEGSLGALFQDAQKGLLARTG